MEHSNAPRVLEINRKMKHRLISLLFIVGLLATVAALVPAQSPDNALLAKLDCPDRVQDVGFSPDGKLIAAGYGWNVKSGVRIWNATDHSVVANLIVGKADDANVSCVTFSPDNQWFAAGDWNGNVFLWRVGNWKSYKPVILNRGMSESLSFSPDSAKLALASDTDATMYDLRSGRITVIAGRKDRRYGFITISFSPDSKSVLFFRDAALQVWDLSTRKLIKTVKPPGSGFFGKASRDGKYAFATGSVDNGKQIAIWEALAQKKIGEFRFRESAPALVVSHSMQLFAVGGGNFGSGGNIGLWRLKDFKEVGYVSFGEFPIEALAFSPDDSVLAAASNDGYVLLYAVNLIRGPEVKKQDYALCGEILNEGNRVFIVPLSKVPGGRLDRFSYAWKREIVNPDSVASLAGAPVELSDWNIESSSDDDRARINQFKQLAPVRNANHIVFGDIQNPGWNEGLLAKIYGDGSFVVTNNFGHCLAYGSLDQFKTNFESVKARLVSEGLLGIPKAPLIVGAAHFRTRFIELAVDGVPELRTDADSIDVLLKGVPAEKREAFWRVFSQEESFINSLRQAGMKPPASQH